MDTFDINFSISQDPLYKIEKYPIKHTYCHSTFLIHTIFINTIGEYDSGLILSKVLICKLSEGGNLGLIIFRSPEELNLH